jgi:enterochelin esterase-like enzyme
LTPTMAPDTGSVSAAESPTEPTVTPMPDVCPYLRGRTETGTITSVAMGEQPRYLVHLPPCYDQYPNRAFPTLYLFHGWPLNEWHWIDLGVADWADDWVSRGLIGPFIIVMPGVSQNGRYVHSSGGDGSFEGFVVNELVPHIDAAYRTIVDPSGRAVGGISRGGVWALEIALRNQDVFSRVGGHSPALAVNNPLPQYDPYLLIREDISGLQFYLDAGTVDWTRSGLIRFRDALIDQEANVTYEVHEGNHVDALWRGAMSDYVAFYTAAWPTDYEVLPSWGERDRSVQP